MKRVNIHDGMLTDCHTDQYVSPVNPLPKRLVAASNGEMSLVDIQEFVSELVPDRDALRWRGRTTTHQQLTNRTRRIANAFLQRGLGTVVPRVELEPWQGGQDFVGLYMRNRPEYIELVLGALKARCVPYNINYRYGPAEIRALVSAAPTLAVAYEADFVEIVAEIRNELADNVLLIEVGGSSVPILEGAIPLEQLITDSSEMQPAAVSSPDDLYVIFTGGTTGPPKAVMWRQADAFVSALNGPSPDLDENTTYLDAIERTVSETPRLVLPAPPFMHGGGQWVALAALLSGNTVVIQEVVDHLDCADIWSTVERERVTMMLVAGNAYGVPLTDDLVANSYDLSSLKIILTGSVAMTSDVKLALIDAIPHIRIIETMGATESGVHLRHVATGNTKRSAGFTASAETVVLNETKERHLEAGESGTGWLARTGRIPLGYLDDAERTLNTFPIINGVRYSVPGDRAQVLSSGEIEFLGRDSMSINSGGEKIFAEEVEAALAASPEVFDVVVSSRDHPRWGQEVVALVSLRPGFTVTSEELKERASSHIARYKVPKLIAFVDYVQRNAVGKPDYAWARDQASKM